MADVNIPITGVISSGMNVKPNDRLLTYERWGVKKLEVITNGVFIINGIIVMQPGQVLEFPTIGTSLPCVFTPIFITENSSFNLRVVEYGNQPDPDYFNITGVDEEGKPVYAEETNAEPDTSIPMGD